MKNINVTKTFLPPIDEYQAILKRSWDNYWLTNRGELVVELEDKLKKLLDVPYLTCTTNGTLPIQIAIKALGLSGEIITTPFSYVATTSSIVWEGCRPVFVDIHPEYFTIDVSKIENAITENTSAILATHVFGNPCDVESIEQIAKKHNLKVIYDAAHCFGVKYKGKSIFNYGDISTCSFHATKIFHTGEGGCFITNDQELHKRLYYHHNFGHDGPNKFFGVGTNAKMSELQGAMGLAVFPYINEIFDGRRKTCKTYSYELEDKFQLIKIRPETKWNYHYFPIVFKSEEELLISKNKLNGVGIQPRRYFYPSLNQLSYVSEKKCPISESLSKRILCLPLWHNVPEPIIKKIVNILK